MDHNLDMVNGWFLTTIATKAQDRISNSEFLLRMEKLHGKSDNWKVELYTGKGDPEKNVGNKETKVGNENKRKNAEADLLDMERKTKEKRNTSVTFARG